MAYKENGSVVVNNNGEWTHSSFNTYTLTQSNIEATQTKITASDAAEGDDFGTAVAVGNGRIVVGAFNNDDVPNNSGSAYIFDLDGTNQIKITASDAAGNDYFGRSVAVGSGKIVVGAYGNDDVPSNSGSAYIFDLDGTNQIKITASDAAGNDWFGYAVAVGGGRIVVGAYGDDGGGSAYIFDLDGNQLKKITASDAAANDEFGNSVAVGNGRIVVGAHLNDDNGTNSGSAYIFDLNGNQLAKITASDAAAEDYFGESVAVGNGRIVVGAPGDNSSRGSAYIFDLNGTQLAKLTASDGASGDIFGELVAVGNGRIVVGAPGDNSSGGSAYIFDLDGTQLAKLTASDAANNDQFGYRAAVGNGRIVVGAYGDADAGARTGSAYIYDLPETTDIYWENIIENYKW